jgi:hypothetical protein
MRCSLFLTWKVVVLNFKRRLAFLCSSWKHFHIGLRVRIVLVNKDSRTVRFDPACLGTFLVVLLARLQPHFRIFFPHTGKVRVVALAIADRDGLVALGTILSHNRFKI